MSNIQPHEDVVVFVDAPQAKYSVMRVQAGAQDTDIVRKIGNAAYLVVTFNRAQTLQQAANVAKADGLTYIPENIVAGLRHRKPGISMESIRHEFKRRMEVYTKPAEPAELAEPAAKGFRFPDDDTSDVFREFFRDVFGRKPK